MEEIVIFAIDPTKPQVASDACKFPELQRLSPRQAAAQ